MLVLGINTVGDFCDAALVEGGAVLAVRSEEMSQGHDARLAPLVAELMAEAGKTFDQLDRIAAVVGPGSFAGVRVGVAFARGLGLALEKPVAGITSLEAADKAQGAGRVLVLLPAKRRPPEQSWWAQLVVDGRGVGEPEEADAARLKEMARGADRLAGSAFEDLHLALPAAHGRPEASVAALLVARQGADDLRAPQPIYARAPDARPMDRP
jgi:tRNA threonylcarbamoyladenosine biosynthesis protein TsaB